ncbi:MAG: tetratricopeptide repeat protein [Alphaproteobacteria bacterium]|nr:tetratricopeptide repeat protein [Alphaproteobacteria bacterium]
MADFNLSKALNHHRAGRLAEAERTYRQFLSAHPRHEDARRLLAVLKHQTGRSKDALIDLDALLKDHPHYPEAMANRAVVLASLGRPDEAEAQFRRVLDLAPGFPDAFGPLLRLLMAEERFGEAQELLKQAPSGWPQERAALAHRLGQPDKAETLLRQALGKAPGDPQLLGALAPVLTSLGRHGEAIEAGRAALALNPDLAGVRHALALALLDCGQLTPGWQEFAHRWEFPGFPSHSRHLEAPRWNGKDDLKGKTVLVWREQGVGDEITFASALPDLIERAGQVVVECSAKLVSLFARSFPEALIRAEDRRLDPKAPSIDAHLPMGDLFPFFRPSVESFPKRDAYLIADHQKAAAWKARLDALGGEPKIGIAWKSTLATPSRLPTFLPSLDQLDSLLRVKGVQFVNLQPRANLDEIAQAASRTGAMIHHFDDLDLFDDLDGSAALMASLDKVVAIGTATAILSAALGIPTAMFLLKHAQWDPMGTQGIAWLPRVALFRRAWNESWDAAVQGAAEWAGGERISKAATPAPKNIGIGASGAEALLDQATAAHLAGLKDQAESLYRLVLERDPDRAEALVNLAALQDESGRTPAAIQLLEQARRKHPNEPAIHDNLGRMLIRQDRLEEAVAPLSDALRLEPANAPLMNDLGNALRLLGRLDESDYWLAKAVKTAPAVMQARFNYAKTLRELGRCQEALAQLRTIAHPDPFTLWEIGATCLQMGDLQRGWAGIEYRPGGWCGKNLPDCRGKTVFVQAEQGVGDVLIYGSALADLLKQAERVYLAAPKKLHALLARSFPDILPLDEKEPPPAHHLALPLGSLFHFFRPSLDSFQASSPFLKADPAKASKWKKRLAELGPGKKVGMAWRSTQVTRERARHFPGHPSALAPLLALQGVVAINLQAQARPEELNGLASFADCDLFDDLDETAALISALDGVAVNGSAIGMLAGGLGVPTALLLRAHASWDRLGTDHLPWLPAAKLFDCAWNEPWETAASKAAEWVKALPPRSNV